MKTRLTKNDVTYISAALNLRAEACEENGEMKDAKRWLRIKKKVIDIYTENRPAFVTRKKCIECKKLFPWLKDRCDHCGRRQ